EFFVQNRMVGLIAIRLQAAITRMLAFVIKQAAGRCIRPFREIASQLHQVPSATRRSLIKLQGPSANTVFMYKIRNLVGFNFKQLLSTCYQRLTESSDECLRCYFIVRD